MKIYIGSDHAGYDTKGELISYLVEQGHEVVDKGAYTDDPNDDYPDYILPVAKAVVNEVGSFGIILGASGQGEAMAANRIKGARAAVYYGKAPKDQVDSSGKDLDILSSARMHNDANILSLGARFLGRDEVHEAIRVFLHTGFSGEERHIRRIKELDL